MSTIANRYARALADVIVAKNETKEVAAEMQQFAQTVAGHAQLRDVFASPVLAQDRKRAVLDDLLNSLQYRQTTQNFLRVLCANNRLHELGATVVALGKELDERTGIVAAEITTAREIDAKEKQVLTEKLKAATGKEVRLQFKIDPAIIGGVVTRIGSKVYDGSIKNQLAQMKQRLKQN